MTPPAKFRVTFRTWRKERCHWMTWLKLEHELYADPKFDGTRNNHDVWMREHGVAPDSEWRLQVMQYMQRAHVLGLDSLQGRQALVKGLAAYTGCVESMLRVYGNLPAPGYTSGEIHEWDGAGALLGTRQQERPEDEKPR